MRLNGAMIKDALDEKNLTQDQAADALKMSQATFTKAVNGGDILASTGHRILQFLDLNKKAIVPRVQLPGQTPDYEGNGDAA